MENAFFDISLKHITIDSFRLFSFLELDFHKKLTVLIGANGAGKTSILDVIAHLLHLQMEYCFAIENEGQVKGKDVKNGTVATLCQGTFDLNYPEADAEDDYSEDEITDATSAENSTMTEEGIGLQEWEQVEEFDVSFGFDINRTTGKTNPIDLTKLEEFKQACQLFFREDDAYPVLAYYGHRLDIKDPQHSRTHQGYTLRQEVVYHQALSPHQFTFDELYHWFDLLTKIKDTPTIRLISEAILVLLNDDPQNPVYRNLRMHYDRDFGSALMVDKKVEGQYLTVEVNQMSSGEKKLIALVGDLGRRLIAANPVMPHEDDTPLKGKGIVLIDELDLHLHPRWQRKAMPALRQIFPNLQFVITTHSPLVIQNIVEGKIYKLDNQNLEKETLQVGASIEDVYKVMSLTSEELISKRYEDLNKKFEEAYQANDYLQAKAIFQDLEEIIPGKDSNWLFLKAKLRSINPDYVPE